MTLRDTMRKMLKESDDQSIKGGRGDDADISKFCPYQVIAGMSVELEHTEDAKQALEIVSDHLTEDPAYYSTVIPFDEVKKSLSKVVSVIKKGKSVEEMMTSGNLGGFSQTAMAMGQPGAGYIDASKPTRAKFSKKSKKSSKKT